MNSIENTARLSSSGGDRVSPYREVLDKDALIYAISTGSTIDEACAKVGVSRAAVDYQRKIDKQFGWKYKFAVCAVWGDEMFGPLEPWERARVNAWRRRPFVVRRRG